MPRGGLAALLALSAGACAGAPPLPEAETPVLGREEPTSLDVLCKPYGGGFCVPGRALTERLARDPIEVLGLEPTKDGAGGAAKGLIRIPGDPELVLEVKMKAVNDGGSGFNNDPRKQVAAYELSELLFPPGLGVVPPTTVRCIPARAFPVSETKLPEFRESQCVMTLVQLWLPGLEQFEMPKAPLSHPQQAALSRFDLFTFMVEHGDSNPFNFLMTKDSKRPHYLSIDHEFAFSGIVFNPLPVIEGKDKSGLEVETIPDDTARRIHALNPTQLRRLATVAEFRLRDGVWTQVDPGANMDEGSGFRVEGDRLQFGLTEEEIEELGDKRIEVLEKLKTGSLRILDDGRNPSAQAEKTRSSGQPRAFLGSDDR